jgi:hypothetical protein
VAFRCPLEEDHAGALGKRKGFKFKNRKGIPTAAKKELWYSKYGYTKGEENNIEAGVIKKGIRKRLK